MPTASDTNRAKPYWQRGARVALITQSVLLFFVLVFRWLIPFCLLESDCESLVPKWSVKLTYIYLNPLENGFGVQRSVLPSALRALLFPATLVAYFALSWLIGAVAGAFWEQLGRRGLRRPT